MELISADKTQESRNIDGVAIVIPCLNESETIGEAVIESRQALAQLDVPGEVLVADNGSTDGSQDIARREGARVVPIAARGLWRRPSWRHQRCSGTAGWFSPMRISRILSARRPS